MRYHFLGGDFIKIKSFFHRHYRKFITVVVFSLLAFCILFSQVSAIQYKINLLDYYRMSVYDSYWQTYNGHSVNSSDYKTNHVIGTHTASNNRFTGLPNEYDEDYNNLFRFDLIIRFNDYDFQLKKGDVLTFSIFMSTNCFMYDRITVYPQLQPSQFYLKFFRVWFEDETFLVFYPAQIIQTAYQVNDNQFTFVSDPLTSDKPRIVSVNFSFNLVEPAYNWHENGNGVPNTEFNVWFNNYFQLYVDRDPLSSSYPKPNDNGIINDHNRVEDQIDNGIHDGLNDSQNMFQNFGDTFLSNDSRIYRGLLFVTNTLNRFFHIEIFTTLGQFALSLGLFAFLVGIVQLVKSSIERHNNNNNNRNGGSG